MSLTEFAADELRIVGMPVDGPPEDVNTWMAKSIMAVIEAFADCGHSGSSAAYAISLQQKLMNWENISPLTTNPEEWNNVGDGLWQSRRNPAVFSVDGGVTCYHVAWKSSEESVPTGLFQHIDHEHMVRIAREDENE